MFGGTIVGSEATVREANFAGLVYMCVSQEGGKGSHMCTRAGERERERVKRFEGQISQQLNSSGNTQWCPPGSINNAFGLLLTGKLERHSLLF